VNRTTGEDRPFKYSERTDTVATRIYKRDVADAERVLFRAVSDMDSARIALRVRLVGKNAGPVSEAMDEVKRAEEAVLAAALEWQQMADSYDAYISLARHSYTKRTVRGGR
jgi:hypothetical protein